MNSLIPVVAMPFAATPSVAVPSANTLAVQASCLNCSMHQLCLPMGMGEADMRRFNDIIDVRCRIKRDATLYRAGDPFVNLYAIRFGHFKTFQHNGGSEQQITGFQMAGDLLGMDAICGNRHQCDAVALEDSEVCEIPFSRLEELFCNMPRLLHHFHRIMSSEITREQTAMLVLSHLRAEQRFAEFLVSLGVRYAARGYSPVSFTLRMSREDIGSYLGLTIESVSRMLNKFKRQGCLGVHNREIVLLDLARLKLLAAGACD